MPYSDAWNTTRPAGSVAAKNIDDEIRVLRLQLEQRLESALVEDMSADPIVAKDSVLGLALGLQRIVPFSSFTNDLHARENDISAGGQLNGFCGSGPWIASIDIPPGCTIVKVEWLTDKHDATSLTCTLVHRGFTAAPAGATIDSTTSITAIGATISPSIDLNVLIDTNAYYFLAITGNGTAGNSFIIYAARVTFNRDSTAHAT